MKLNKWICVTAVLAAGAVAYPAGAQEKFPTKNIRMLVPFAAGSQTDILARWIGEEFLKSWGQQVVVDNRPSAGGTIASQVVLDANADGHTMMMVSTGHAGNATLFSKLPYDTIKDFAGVSQVASVPNVLVVAPTAWAATPERVLTAFAASSLTAAAAGLSISLSAQSVNWPAYGNDAGGLKYSPLTEINRETVARLKKETGIDAAAGSEPPCSPRNRSRSSRRNRR